MREIADRRHDLAMAQSALSQIEAGFNVAQKADHGPLVAELKGAADRARLLMARLSGRP
jgi:hypothetical protein